MEQATSIELFVEILDRYVYYFDQQNESVSKTLILGVNPELDSHFLGHHQIHQRAYRTHPLQPEHEPARFGEC